MAPTRITIVLEVDHEPEVVMPARAAHALERMLSGVEGLDVVSIVRAESDHLAWTPPGVRMAS